ncbi:MAG: hypothetical protein BAJALOKI1v1_590026 [Promethearchaeota archaeon]|nr:MAG: hypothetical protein BAJALOKI1v1_590026 [Candidatus Lokiarchaeota archaeon]
MIGIVRPYDSIRNRFQGMYENFYINSKVKCYKLKGDMNE